MTLRARIAAVAGVAVALAVLATAALTYVAVRSSLRSEVDDSLRRRSERLPDLPDNRPFAPSPGRPVPGRHPGLLDRLRPEAGGGPFGGVEAYAQFIRPEGSVLRPPAAAPLPVEPRARELARRGSGSYFADMTVRGTHLRVFTRAGGAGAVQIARPLEEIDSQLRRILIVLAVVGAVGIALGVALGAVVARAALVPIARFTRRTESVGAAGDLSRRIEVVGRDELARLARSFNTNLDALERSVEAQRHLVADASHELRTPIASLRANIQTLQDAHLLPPEERERMRADIVDELDELTALVGDVMELARGGKPGEAEDDVRLDQVVDSLVERARRRAANGVTFDTDLEPGVVRGDPERIARAVSNLVGNALKWSPSGGAIEIGLAGGVLSIRDHGPGFEPPDVPHVFERFYRTAAARGMAGSGLGLAIVEQAAQAHGGFAEASNAPGGGALLRVSFGPSQTVSDPDSEPATSPV